MANIKSKTIISEEKIEKILEESPDLTYALIKDILISQQEAEAGLLEPYILKNNTPTF